MGNIPIPCADSKDSKNAQNLGKVGSNGRTSSLPTEHKNVLISGSYVDGTDGMADDSTKVASRTYESFIETANQVFHNYDYQSAAVINPEDSIELLSFDTS